MIKVFVHNASELLALLCVAGFAACGFRWRNAIRRDFLLAFALFLVGTFVREYLVWRYGVTGWPPEALTWTGIGRLFQIAGAALFVRSALKQTCGEWAWIAIFAIAALIASLL